MRIANEYMHQKVVVQGFRDANGFGRPVDVGPNVFSVAGPDDQQHSVHCQFITERGILACSCDASRVRNSWWWRCWFRWMEVRVRPQKGEARIPWPIAGPDGDPWVPGVDFNDDRQQVPAPAPERPPTGRHRALV